MKINLFNRDGARLWIEQKDNSDIWELKVDNTHKWVLEYMRVIGHPKIEAVDPSGGPYISLGSILKDSKGNKYEIIEIINYTTFRLKEENGNN